jgi:hypothetical protein
MKTRKDERERFRAFVIEAFFVCIDKLTRIYNSLQRVVKELGLC